MKLSFPFSHVYDTLGLYLVVAGLFLRILVSIYMKYCDEPYSSVCACVYVYFSMYTLSQLAERRSEIPVA